VFRCGSAGGLASWLRITGVLHKLTALLVPLLAISLLPASPLSTSLLSGGYGPPSGPLAESALQAAVDKALGNRAGSIVVVDVNSKRIVASSNLELAATELVRPGSTLKPFVLMELVRSGKLDPAQYLRCRRPLVIGGMRLDCAHSLAVSELDADDAIAYSCNSYVAEVALRMSANDLAQTLRRAELDSPTGLVKSESTGQIEPARDREQIQLQALGQRGIDVSLLELLEAYRKLALARQSTDAKSVQAVYEGLEHSVTYGMGHAAYVEGMKIAGKTGTATEFNNPHTHGIFVGYAPADRPEIAMMVYLQGGRGLDAAGIAKPIFAAYGGGSETH
jgi:cell division protein FtsI/penicillin-binding protein 2